MYVLQHTIVLYLDITSIITAFCSFLLSLFPSLSSPDGGQPFSSSRQHALKQEEKFGIVVSGQGEFGDVELNKKRSTIFTIR